MAENQLPKILLAEDDEYISRAYIAGLERDGFVVVHAKDGDETIKILGEDKTFNLMLLDILMPGKDGFAVLKHVRKTEGLKELPVFILSNLGQKSDVKKANKLGASGYMIKANHSMNDVIEVVRKALPDFVKPEPEPTKIIKPTKPIQAPVFKTAIQERVDQVEEKPISTPSSINDLQKKGKESALLEKKEEIPVVTQTEPQQKEKPPVIEKRNEPEKTNQDNKKRKKKGLFKLPVIRRKKKSTVSKMKKKNPEKQAGVADKEEKQTSKGQRKKQRKHLPWGWVASTILYVMVLGLIGYAYYLFGDDENYIPPSLEQEYISDVVEVENW